MQKIKKYKIIAIVFAVIVIPLVYSFFYLDAFWDPYSKLDKLPVAIVNQDTGATINGETRNLGKEITDRIKTDKNLKWVITSDSDAKDGVENRRYYASVIIPGDFSKNISTAGESTKSKGILIYNVNEKRNYLASQVLNRVSLEFKDEISKDISKEIVGTLVDQVQNLPDDLKKLDDGLKKLDDGTATAYDKTGDLINGQTQFNNGLQTLNKGLIDANNGSKALSGGAGKLSDGANQFYQGLLNGSKKIPLLTKGSETFSIGLSNVNDGLNKLNSGAGQISQKSGELDKNIGAYNQNMQAFTAGLNNYVASVNKASEAEAGVANLIAKYAQSHPEALKDENFQTIINTLQATKSAPEQIKKAGENVTATSKALSDGSGKISAGMSQFNQAISSLSQNSALLSAGTNKLNDSYSQINSGIQEVGGSITAASQNSKELSDGALAIKNGVNQLSTGIAKASDGSRQLTANSSKLLDGDQKLQSGLGEIKKGISEASDGVSSSLLKADDQLKNTDGLKEYVSEPIQLSENKVNGIPDYGTAFTPYFVSLSLWVGALLMFFAIYLDPDVKFRRMSNNSRGILRFLSYTFIGIAQALVLDIVILNALHLHVKNIGLFFLVSIIISLSFVSIMRFLLVQLRDVGKFIAILLLILQLTSCGGTFPMELVPDFFKVINPFMPMTYSVNSLKEVISGIDYGFLSQNLIVLGAIAVVFLALNFLCSKMRLGKLLADSKESGDTAEDVYANA